MRGGLAAMVRVRFNRRKAAEAKAAGIFFANAGFIGPKNPAGNDAGRGGNIGEAQATAKESGPEEAVSAKAKSEASGGAEAVRKPQRNHRPRSQAKAKAKASGPAEVVSGEAQASGHAEGGVPNRQHRCIRKRRRRWTQRRAHPPQRRSRRRWTQKRAHPPQRRSRSRGKQPRTTKHGRCRRSWAPTRRGVAPILPR